MLDGIIQKQQQQHQLQNQQQKPYYNGSNESSTTLSCWYTNATSLNNKIDELRLIMTVHFPDLHQRNVV